MLKNQIVLYSLSRIVLDLHAILDLLLAILDLLLAILDLLPAILDLLHTVLHHLHTVLHHLHTILNLPSGDHSLTTIHIILDLANLYLVFRTSWLELSLQYRAEPSRAKRWLELGSIHKSQAWLGLS